MVVKGTSVTVKLLNVENDCVDWAMTATEKPAITKGAKSPSAFRNARLDMITLLVLPPGGEKTWIEMLGDDCPAAGFVISKLKV